MLSKINIIILLLLIVLSSCAPRLVGTWSIQKFETTSHDEPGASLTNIGTITFKKNGTGTKELNYSVLGITREDKRAFTWRASDKMVTLEGEFSDLAKTWIQVVDKGKFQQWKSTEGTQVQVLELRK